MGKCKKDKIIQTEPNSYCCPRTELIQYESCVDFVSLGATGGAGYTFYSVDTDVSLATTIGFTIYSDISSTGTISCQISTDMNGIPVTTLTVSIAPGSSVTLYGDQIRSSIIVVPPNVFFTGRACVKSNYLIPV